jgi:hypothetical protein
VSGRWEADDDPRQATKDAGRRTDSVALSDGGVSIPTSAAQGSRIAYLYAMAAREAGQRDFVALRFQEEFGDSF